MKARHELLNSTFERAIFFKAREGVLPEVPSEPEEAVLLSGDAPAVLGPLGESEGRPPPLWSVVKPPC